MAKKSSKAPSVPDAAPLKVETPANKEKKSRTVRHTSPRTKKTEVVAETPVATTSIAVAAYEDVQTEIARLAYFFWQERGSAPGNPEEDWLRAEREIATKMGA